MGAESATQTQRGSVRVKVEFHVGNGRGRDGRAAIPGGQEVNPPPDVRAGIGGEVYVVMEEGGGGGKVDEAAEKKTAWFDNLGSKGEMPNE